MACRQTASIWSWLFKKHGSWKFFFKMKIWKQPFFWHDSFGKYFNRFMGCRITGHKRQWMDDGGCNEDKPHWYCFRCDQVISCSHNYEEE